MPVQTFGHGNEDYYAEGDGDYDDEDGDGNDAFSG